MVAPPTIWVLVLISIGSTLCSADPRADYQGLLQMGEAARAKQQWKQAQQVFAEAYSLAEKNNDKRAQAESAMKCALSHRAEASTIDSPAIDQAIAWYEKAIKYGAKDQVALAANNLGVIFVQQQRFDKAIDIYRKYVVSKSNTNNSDLRTDQVFYLCNYAQALEKAGNDKSVQEAYVIYWRVLRSGQQYPPAADGILRVLLRSVPHNYDESARLIEFLLPIPAEESDESAVGMPSQVELAGRYLSKLLQAWSNEPGVERLLPGVIRYFELAVTTPSEATSVGNALMKDPRNAGSIAKVIEEIRRIHDTHAFAGMASYLFFNPEEVWQLLPELRKVGSGTSKEAKLIRTALSRLLLHIGDYYFRESMKQGGGRNAPSLPSNHAAEQALARYSAAYQLDLSSIRAALNVAATLHEHRTAFKPALEQQFIERLWDIKIQAYQKLQPSNKEDWVNIASLHRILATIFEKEARAVHPENPSSPVYQWKHALEAEKRIQSLDKTYPANPSLHLSLAKAWEQANVNSKAFESYLDAAEGFQKIGHSDKAIAAVTEADRVRSTKKFNLDAIQIERYEQFAQDLPRPRPHEVPRVWAKFQQKEGVTALAFTPRAARMVFTGSSNMKSVDLKTGEQSSVEMPKERRITALAFSRDGKWLAVGRDRGISMRDGDSYREIGVLAGNEAPVVALDFVGGGPRFVAASADGVVNLWDAAAAKKIHHFESPRGPTSSVVYGNDNRSILFASKHEGQIRILSLKTGQEIRRLEGHERGIDWLAVSPDGNHLVSAGLDQTARLWDLRSGQAERILWHHEKAVRCVAISPTGKIVAAVSMDGIVKVWDLLGKELATLEGVDEATSLAFGPDGDLLAQGGGGKRNRLGQVIIWKLK